MVALDRPVARTDREDRVLVVSAVEARVLDPEPVDRDVIKHRRRATRSARACGGTDADGEPGGVEDRTPACADRDSALRDPHRLVVAARRRDHGVAWARRIDGVWGVKIGFAPRESRDLQAG